MISLNREDLIGRLVITTSLSFISNQTEKVRTDRSKLIVERLLRNNVNK